MQIAGADRTQFSDFFRRPNLCHRDVMLEDASNQELIDAWKRGEETAAQILVRRYMVRLTALARSRLSRKLARRLDPEDVVMSAWRSFFVATGDGRVVVPRDDDLWPLLVTMTLHKLSRQAARQTAQRRSVDVECRLDADRDWRAALSRDPSPDEAAMLVDEVEVLMESLVPSDRDVLTRRLQGEDHSTIATQVGCSTRSVRRAMLRIQAALAKQADLPAVTQTSNSAELASDRDARSPGMEGPFEESTDAMIRRTMMILSTDIVLQKLVGQGGFGKVYRAVRLSDGATVAVKYLKKKFWKDPRAANCLIDESTRVATLEHQNIVRYFGWGRAPRGAVFVVMEWVEGVNTWDWHLRSRPSLHQILECGAAVADALVVAHAAGIIHGDMTPANVLRRNDGRFLLTDFGFARSLTDTVRSRLGGTPGFLAPEQVSDAFGPIGERTDVYGLGGLIYALLTGQPPVIGDDLPDVLARVISSTPPTAPSDLTDGVPYALNRLLLCCLSKESTERPHSARDVGESLRSLRENL